MPNIMTLLGGGMLRPNVSYCIQENEVHYNPIETRVVAVFNVTSTTNETKIGFNVSNVDKIEIDGVLLDSVVNSYTFDTLGEHTVMYTLKDSTDLQNVPYMNCSNLVSITIPEGVTNIGDSAFDACTTLTSVAIPNSVTNIGSGAFSYCRSLTSVTIPNGVSAILTNTFYYCSGLTSVTIPNSVTSIGSGAFDGCNGLTSITIPYSVSNIGTSAFYCSGLTSVTIEATTPPTLGSTVFNVNTSGRKIYVPSASVDAYKSASGWSVYANDIEAIQ